jgi:hypothetical protein
MNQQIKYLQDDQGNNLLSHYRITTNKYGQEIVVPVVDVRDGIAYRMMAYQMGAASSRSKYIPYNEYHRSRKPKTNI